MRFLRVNRRKYSIGNNLIMSQSDKRENINFQAINITYSFCYRLTFATRRCSRRLQQYFYSSTKNLACLTRQLIVKNDRFASCRILSLRTYIEKRESIFLRITDDYRRYHGRFHGGQSMDCISLVTGFSASQMGLGGVDQITKADRYFTREKIRERLTRRRQIDGSKLTDQLPQVVPCKPFPWQPRRSDTRHLLGGVRPFPVEIHTRDDSRRFTMIRERVIRCWIAARKR